MTDHVSNSASEDRTMPAVVYALYLVGLTHGLTIIIGLILAYASRSAAGPVMQSHYTFQIRTFWLSIGWFLIGCALMFWGAIFSVVLIGIRSSGSAGDLRLGLAVVPDPLDPWRGSSGPGRSLPAPERLGRVRRSATTTMPGATVCGSRRASGRPLGRHHFAPHHAGVVVHQAERDVARPEVVLADLRHRRDLRGGAHHEALGEARELFRLDVALDHLEALLLGEPDHRLAGDPVQEAVGVGVWRAPSFMKNTFEPVLSAT
jgi:uncharacterized membrane protein